MQTLKFKTDLKCAGCMYAIKPYMDALEGIESWDVDLNSKDKIVKVVTKTASKEEIQEAIEDAIAEAGYSAELVH
ncbi:MAG: heavy-metal-associated domain-containing protein [Bacteroidota bacterium]